MSFKADMHMHSYFSDGTNSPKDLIALAKKNNINAISITDHDTVAGYNKNLFTFAKKNDVILIAGSEISSEFMNESIHILAYNFDLKNIVFLNFLKEIQKRKKERNKEILKKLQKYNIEISLQELYEFALSKGVSKTVVGRPHISMLMKEKKYISTIQEAFDKYFRDNGPCYVSGLRFSAEEVIKIIHQANGKAFIAHPHLISQKAFKKLINLPFDGIEVYYSKLFLHIETQFLKKAKEKKLLISGGSDFHGDLKPHISLGCSWVDEEAFNKIIN
ncbi:MAG: hypothetical protein A3F40_04435 [Chlamydiae bacterium RIFCSPHIGHO2_12_FULL_27_8]|nr:MAG: hypothetical protein A3F40_04435 [Chlamydiae bacterium RIFCSPHIGHO2_12_FULL_27_8]OGN65788.1 MAG: hypothetical protein A2888_00160 [Chlamydiae bacterium RIFCSPLOWO2_01_FULL_28_7]